MAQNISKHSQLTVSTTISTHPFLEFGYLSDKHNQGELTALLPFEVLAQSSNYREIWQVNDEKVVANETINDTANDIKCDQIDQVRLIHSDQFLAVVHHTKSSDLDTVVDVVYDQAFSYSQALGFTHLIRVWNYFPAINHDVAGMENYQRFCIARHVQLERHQQLNQANPAATAIGTQNQHSAYIFIFAKQPGEVIENKRQVSAWEYPLHYSPKQPRFSRAMQVGGLLMCSGTASVVGHQTKHKDNLSRQFNECLTNIKVLLDSAGHEFALESGMFRFYLRHPKQLTELQNCIANAGLLYYVVLAGDICRQDLLVECEAVFQ